MLERCAKMCGQQQAVSIAQGGEVKRIIEAIVASSNLVYLVRECPADDPRLHDAAEKTLRRLSGALDEVAELKKRGANGEL